MFFNYNTYNKAEPSRMYLALPGRKVIGSLLGIKSAKFHPQLRDIWEIDFEIDSVLTTSIGELIDNPIFSKLQQYMEIKVENIGWFRINETPEELLDNDGRYYKRFTAMGYETTLQDLDLNLFYVNCGIDESIEMYPENLNAINLPKQNIQLWIKEANEDPTSTEYWKLGLLNILEHEYLYKKGWKIGHVDVNVSNKRGRQFEIDTENIYAFLTQDVSKSYKCLFSFDRENLEINIHSIENLGKDLEMELSLRNVINSITIKSQNENVYTSFRVSGADNEQALLEYINYGSDRLYNFDYFIETNMIPEDTAKKYKKYEEWLNAHRKEYANLSLESLKIDEKISAIQEQVPIDEVEVLYENLSLDELNTELASAKNVVALLEEMHTVDGVLEIENTSDYSMYMSFKEVIIPKLEAEIKSRDPENDITEEQEEIDWETNWELYGTNELTVKLVAYQRQLDILKEKGYDQPWSSETGTFSQEFHDRQYELFQKYNQYVVDINVRLEKLNNDIAELKKQKDTITTQIREMGAKAKVSHEDWGFTKQELSLLDILTIETDFSDSTIEIQDNNTLDEIIDLAEDLYDSAVKEMEIESRPQLSFDISVDNLFHIQKYKNNIGKMEIGDFVFMELMNGYKTKQRIIGMEIELINFNDSDLQFEFSDSVRVNGQLSDYDFLLDKSGSSSKNSISKSSSETISALNNFSTIAADILVKYISGSGSNGLITSGMSDADLKNLADALTGMIEVKIQLDQLASELGKIERLALNSSFMKFLSSIYEVDNQASFTKVKETVSNVTMTITNIKELLSGVPVGDDVIHLTTKNLLMDDDVITDNIGKKLTISDLNESAISSGKFPIISPKNAIKFDGDFITATDMEGITRFEVGISDIDEFVFRFRDKDGNLIIDENGIVEKDNTELE